MRTKLGQKITRLFFPTNKYLVVLFVCLFSFFNIIWQLCHVDYITAKASKKLYSLRLLKRAGVREQDMLKVFRSSVRPILEYAVQVWHDILDYLSDRIESVQKTALKIIYANSSYSQAMSLANETTISNRRELLCHQLWLRWQTPVTTHYRSWCPPLYIYYNLRPGSSRPFNKSTRTKWSENFFTFKYSSLKYLSWLSF